MTYTRTLLLALLAHLGVIVALAPMLAPVAGGVVLQWLSWPWVFFIQAAWGVSPLQASGAWANP